MNIKLIVATFMLSFGTYTTAAQLQPQVPVKSEASIIKSVAASLKSEAVTHTAHNHTTLDQLIKSNQQNKSVKVSQEESRALASITPKQNIFISRGKNISNFIQSLFGG